MLVGIMQFIVWDVDPDIFSVKLLGVTLPIAWYGLFFALSFLLGQQRLYYIFRQEAKPSADVDKLTIYVVLATIIGARLGGTSFFMNGSSCWKSL